MRRNPLFTATLISLVLHGYVAWSLLAGLAVPSAIRVAAILWLAGSALLTPAPLLIRLSALPERAADTLAWAGYLAMGTFSSLIILTFIRDLGLGATWTWAAVSGRVPDWHRLRLLSTLAVLSVSGSISLIGLWNARRLAKVVSVDLPIAGLPEALAGFTIVQLSDIHVGPTIKRGYLSSIVQKVNSLNADLVAITGDVIDGSVSRLRTHVQPLAELRSRYGTYCVTGNHEYYHGADSWLKEWERLGLKALLNANEVLVHNGVHVLIGGVADFSAGHFDKDHTSDPVAAARTTLPVELKMLLAHQPRSAASAALAGFDVQLSGHTHGGQFLPWNFFVPLQQPFTAGLGRVKNLLVYTSRGTGYWGPPLRFCAPSEITRLRLVPAPLKPLGPERALDPKVA